MKPFGRSTLVVFMTLIAMALAAQEGSMDLSFNPSDAGFGSGDGPNSRVFATALQTNGKILVGGSFTTYNSAPANGIARLNADGSLDASFNVAIGANGWVRAMAVQTDGKVLIAGTFTTYSGTARNRIARVNGDGSLDTGFDPGAGADNTIRSLVIQADGKILIGGEFTTYNGTARGHVARVNTDGSLDAGFDPGTGSNDIILAVAVQADNKILVGGDFDSFNGSVKHYLARLNIDGTLDTGFPTGYGPHGDVDAMIAQSDGKIIVAGGFGDYDNADRNSIARINPDGSLDLTFTPGTGANGRIGSIARRSNGKLIVGGYFWTFNGIDRTGIAQLNSDGSLDTGFNYNGWITWNVEVMALAVQSDGKLVVGNWSGDNYGGGTTLMRLNTDGGLDTAFDRGYGANSSVRAIAQQPDGKILVGGTLTRYAGMLRNRIARLNTNGTLDTGFNPGLGANNPIQTIALQPDGKILIGGWFTTYDGVARSRIARLNTNGTLDPGFVSGTGPDYLTTTINTLALQPDGKVLIGGDFISYNGTGRNRIARLNPDGSLDPGFDPGTGANNIIRSMVLQPDGKVLIGGYFTSFNGVGRDHIARLNGDGTLDAAFDPGAVAGSDVYSIALLADGDILIGGWFTSVNGVGRNHIARLNANGTLDTGFDPGTGADWTVLSIAVQPDSRILIGGGFSNYNGVQRKGLARLQANGSLDISFDSGTGLPPGGCNAIQQSAGKILIVGSFTSYNGIGRDRIARINGTARTNILVRLEGPYNPGTLLMNDALRTLPSFPLTEPFTAMGYAETGSVSGATIGSSVLSVTGNNAIVDWVIVEMRPVATPGTVVASRAVLLQRDGEVVDLDGLSTVGFAGLAPGNYCLAVKPRNHLPVMSSPTTPVNYGSANATANFTLSGTQVYDIDARKNVSGVMVLAAGDVTFNETVQYTGASNDRDPILTRVGSTTPNNSVSGYWREDVNMDGVVKYTGSANDRDIILTNVGSTTPNNTSAATLP